MSNKRSVTDSSIHRPTSMDVHVERSPHRVPLSDVAHLCHKQSRVVHESSPLHVIAIHSPFMSSEFRFVTTCFHDVRTRPKDNNIRIERPRAARCQISQCERAVTVDSIQHSCAPRCRTMRVRYLTERRHSTRRLAIIHFSIVTADHRSPAPQLIRSCTPHSHPPIARQKSTCMQNRRSNDNNPIQSVSFSAAAGKHQTQLYSTTAMSLFWTRHALRNLTILLSKNISKTMALPTNSSVDSCSYKNIHLSDCNNISAEHPYEDSTYAPFQIHLSHATQPQRTS